MKYNSRRERNQKKRERRKQREARLQNERTGPVMPTMDENNTWTMKNNLQHRAIMNTINNKWDKIAGVRRRKHIPAE